MFYLFLNTLPALTCIALCTMFSFCNYNIENDGSKQHSEPLQTCLPNHSQKIKDSAIINRLFSENEFKISSFFGFMSNE